MPLSRGLVPPGVPGTGCELSAVRRAQTRIPGRAEKRSFAENWEPVDQVLP